MIESGASSVRDTIPGRSVEGTQSDCGPAGCADSMLGPGS